MRTYRGIGSRNAVTPQNEPIPGSKQVPNNAGGYTWAIDDWERLHRFLILGSEGGTYYVKERELTKDNAAVVERCIKADGPRTVREIATVSTSGSAPKNDPALLALAMCVSLGDDETKRLAFTVLPEVARIGTHLLHFISFAEQFRGWGPAMRRAIGSWFNDKQPLDLAYQVTKYPSRDKWAMSDALRLAHPKPASDTHNALYKWVVDSEMRFDNVELDTATTLYMQGRAELQAASDPRVAALLISQYKLPREVVPTELLNSAEVWEALLQDMPMTAMIRNLATMTRVGLIGMLSDAAGTVAERLADAEKVKRARVHPLQLLAALQTYKSGHGLRGQNTWTPVSSVVDALDAAFYLSFDNVIPSGARMLIGLDVSGSMGGTMVAGMSDMDCVRAEACMAMITARTEPRHGIVKFDTNAEPIDITPRMRLDTIVEKVARAVGGGTDCAQPILWATKNKVAVDTFVIYTDSETWAGRMHPKQALDKYRQAMGIPAKLVVVGMVATESSIGDPNDSGILDVVGFDTSAPSIISDFSKP